MYRMALEVLKYSAQVIWTTFMAFLCGDLHTVCGRYECCIIQKLHFATEKEFGTT